MIWSSPSTGIVAVGPVGWKDEIIGPCHILAGRQLVQ
jgi:hypothetical protein